MTRLAASLRLFVWGLTACGLAHANPIWIFDPGPPSNQGPRTWKLYELSYPGPKLELLIQSTPPDTLPYEYTVVRGGADPIVLATYSHNSNIFRIGKNGSWVFIRNASGNILPWSHDHVLLRTFNNQFDLMDMNGVSTKFFTGSTGCYVFSVERHAPDAMSWIEQCPAGRSGTGKFELYQSSFNASSLAVGGPMKAFDLTSTANGVNPLGPYATYTDSKGLNTWVIWAGNGTYYASYHDIYRRVSGAFVALPSGQKGSYQPFDTLMGTLVARERQSVTVLAGPSTSFTTTKAPLFSQTLFSDATLSAANPSLKPTINWHEVIIQSVREGHSWRMPTVHNQSVAVGQATAATSKAAAQDSGDSAVVGQQLKEAYRRGDLPEKMSAALLASLFRGNYKLDDWLTRIRTSDALREAFLKKFPQLRFWNGDLVPVIDKEEDEVDVAAFIEFLGDPTKCAAQVVTS